MNLVSLCWLAFNLLSTFFGLVYWWQAGRKFPLFIHRLALVLGVVGALVALPLAITVGLGWVAAVTCLLVPPSSAYLGWLWLGGPLLTDAGTSQPPQA